MRILLLDNFDSFTYNLVHYFEALDCSVVVVRNNEALPERSSYDALVLSPGPGLPAESGNLMAVLRSHFGTLPLLGVCLGMQALGELTGSQLYNRGEVIHGQRVPIERTPSPEGVLLKGITVLEGGMYHSWAIAPGTLAPQWSLTATAYSEQAPMVIEDTEAQAFGIQFHPESILTPQGRDMVANWVQWAREAVANKHP